MQLKRDTDYAVRILYYLNMNSYIDNHGKKKGVSLSELAKQTGTPKLIAERVCDSLKEKGIIVATGRREASKRLYYSTAASLGSSLLDIIEAVEGSCQLFAVFDKSFAGYKSLEDQIQRIQKGTEKILSEATLGSLFETRKKD